MLNQLLMVLEDNVTVLLVSTDYSLPLLAIFPLKPPIFVFKDKIVVEREICQAFFLEKVCLTSLSSLMIRSLTDNFHA